jgi:hypothetical protein
MNQLLGLVMNANFSDGSHRWPRLFTYLFAAVALSLMRSYPKAFDNVC